MQGVVVRCRAARLLVFALCSVAILSGCRLAVVETRHALPLDVGRLPVADRQLQIAGLGPCTDDPDRTVNLNSHEPVVVLVHGCFGSSGQFRALAQVLAFQGQQTACFTYDDRAALDVSASELSGAMMSLAGSLQQSRITLMGHSQGALVARRAMTEARFSDESAKGAEFRLVTVSGPFAGIAAARACGITALNVISLGLNSLLCRALTGPKYADITSSSLFIRSPGALSPKVMDYLKINTDERGSCRRYDGGRCIESDLIFELEEQYFASVDEWPGTRNLRIKAGHVEIVGDRNTAPVKLIAALQEQGVIRATEPERQSAFRLMLSRVYDDPSLSDEGATRR